jgi:hypothetical protein
VTQILTYWSVRKSKLSCWHLDSHARSSGEKQKLTKLFPTGVITATAARTAIWSFTISILECWAVIAGLVAMILVFNIPS